MQIGLTQHKILNGLFVESLAELLTAAGFQCESPTEPTADEQRPSFVSVLGATGEQLNLSATLKIDHNLLVRSHPMGSAGQEVSKGELEDWCRELNNQLVGRMKNKLLAYGVVVNLGLPVLFSGVNISISAASNQTVSDHIFKFEHGVIAASLATVVAKDLELSPTAPTEETEQALTEGALALF